MLAGSGHLPNKRQVVRRVSSYHSRLLPQIRRGTTAVQKIITSLANKRFVPPKRRRYMFVLSCGSSAPEALQRHYPRGVLKISPFVFLPLHFLQMQQLPFSQIQYRVVQSQSQVLHLTLESKPCVASSPFYRRRGITPP